ncbi:MAG: hypothetical protein ACJAXD_002502, partial [Cryomorphaceae bacterium]
MFDIQIETVFQFLQERILLCHGGKF